MFTRFASLVVMFLLLDYVAASPVAAEPDPPPPPPVAVGESPPPDNGSWPSGEAGFLAAPDKWNLTVRAENESFVAVAPLTTSLASREYVVGGTFIGTVLGGGGAKLTGSTLEAGYRIGCGALVDGMGPIVTASFAPSLRLPFTGGAGGGYGISGGAQTLVKPGVTNIVPVDKKPVKGGDGQIAINGYRIKIDGCSGQSFIQSYATLTGSTEANDDVITYLGVVKVV